LLHRGGGGGGGGAARVSLSGEGADPCRRTGEGRGRQAGEERGGGAGGGFGAAREDARDRADRAARARGAAVAGGAGVCDRSRDVPRDGRRPRKRTGDDDGVDRGWGRDRG